jgi:hypothetical protein
MNQVKVLQPHGALIRMPSQSLSTWQFPECGRSLEWSLNRLTQPNWRAVDLRLVRCFRDIHGRPHAAPELARLVLAYSSGKGG